MILAIKNVAKTIPLEVGEHNCNLLVVVSVLNESDLVLQPVQKHFVGKKLNRVHS